MREDSATTGSAQIWPIGVLPMMRAARFTTSPLTEYDRRRAGPTEPVNARPAVTPARTDSGPGSSKIWRRAQSIASAGSSRPLGAPATSMILPPSAEMSVSWNDTTLR